MNNRKLLPIIAMSAMFFNFSPAFAESVTYNEDVSGGSVVSDASIEIGTSDIENPNGQTSNSANTKVLIGTFDDDNGVKDDFNSLFQFSSGTVKINKVWNTTTVKYDYRLDEEKKSKSTTFRLQNNSEYSQYIELKFTPHANLSLKKGENFIGFIEVKVGAECFESDKFDTDTTNNCYKVKDNIFIPNEAYKEVTIKVNFDKLNLENLVNKMNTDTNTTIGLFSVTCTLVSSNTNNAEE